MIVLHVHVYIPGFPVATHDTCRIRLGDWVLGLESQNTFIVLLCYRVLGTCQSHGIPEITSIQLSGDSSSQRGTGHQSPTVGKDEIVWDPNFEGNGSLSSFICWLTKDPRLSWLPTFLFGLPTQDSSFSLFFFRYH